MTGIPRVMPPNAFHSEWVAPFAPNKHLRTLTGTYAHPSTLHLALHVRLCTLPSTTAPNLPLHAPLQAATRPPRETADSLSSTLLSACSTTATRLRGLPAYK